MSTSLALIAIGFAALLQTPASQAAGGYHYDRPTVPPDHNTGDSNGHYFGPLSTVAPLPPVPAIPGLPTPRPTSHIQTNLYQSHPTASGRSVTPSKSIAAAYLPPSAKYGPPSYRPESPSLLTAPPAPFQFGQRLPETIPSAPAYQRAPSGGQGGYPTAAGLSYPSAPAAPSAPGAPAAPAAITSRFPAFPIITTQAAAQPLRIPFGKQALIHYPTAVEPSYAGPDGRQLKQYAVIEIIDNDIEQPSHPFLSAPVYDSIRAHIGASGTGAVPPAPSTSGFQLDLRSNALALEQQRLLQQQSRQRGDPIALGSGGLGFIRLANGNVYFGSGSLDFISNQQHTQSVFDARNRKEQVSPNPLHFGHGSLEELRNGRK